MNGKKPLQNMMMDSSTHKVSFLNVIASNSFWNFLTILHTVNFICTRLGNVQNTAGVNHSRFCAYGVVAVLKKYQNLKKIGDGYLIAARIIRLNSLLFKYSDVIWFGPLNTQETLESIWIEKSSDRETSKTHYQEPQIFRMLL